MAMVRNIDRAVRRPSSFQVVVIVAALVAGPEIKKANAAPGEAPR